jgi:hypothetical protein
MKQRSAKKRASSEKIVGKVRLGQTIKSMILYQCHGQEGLKKTVNFGCCFDCSGQVVSTRVKD